MSNFPKWNPQKVTFDKFDSSDFKTRYIALRNSSSAFIKKQDVRNYIFERDNNRCVLCEEQENLTIDHYNSVYRVAKKDVPLRMLNIKENLQTLCFECNSGKTP